MIRKPLKVVVNKPAGGRLPGEVFPVATPVVWRVADAPLHEPASHGLLEGADVVVTTLFTPQMGERGRSLKAVLVPAAGYENISREALPQGCVVANAYEHEWPIAEWVVMAMVALDHELLKSDRTFRAGSWEMWPQRHGVYRELRGRTLGIVGLGRIGRQSALIASAMGMRCIAATRTVPLRGALPAGVEAATGMDGLGGVLEGSDFVLVGVPLTSETRGLIGEMELARMKPSAYIINPARGHVISEKALYEALRYGRIAGAAIDTWWTYPEVASDGPRPSAYAFWELDNVIMTPHHSGATTGTLRRRGVVVAENIDRLYRGEPLVNVVAAISRV